MSSAISSYNQAAKLLTPQGSVNTIVGGREDTKSVGNFKTELSNILPGALEGIKKQGMAADAQVLKQVIGVGNVEQTAISLSELNANMEVIAQALRMGIEKLTELTTRTMGG